MVLPGTLPADIEFPKVALPEHVPKRGQALDQQLFPVSDEQDPVHRPCVTKSLVVEGGHNRLAGSRCHDHEVAPPLMDRALRR